MRASVIAGIVLVVLGAFVLIRGGSYFETHDVVKVGDIHVTDTDRHPIPIVVGAIVGAAGLVLIASGARKLL